MGQVATAHDCSLLFPTFEPLGEYLRRSNAMQTTNKAADVQRSHIWLVLKHDCQLFNSVDEAWVWSGSLLLEQGSVGK